MKREMLMLAGVVFIGLAALAGGCGTVEKIADNVDVAVCYYVEGYGEVCLKYDGKFHFRADLTPDALADVKAKLAEKGVIVE